MTKGTGQEVDLWGRTKTTFTVTRVSVCWPGDLLGSVKRQSRAGRGCTGWKGRGQRSECAQWARTDEHNPQSFSEEELFKKKKKKPDCTEKYRFKCLTFLMRGSFSSFYLVHPLFIYLGSVLRCLELSRSRWRGGVLLRLGGGGGSERACWSCCASAWNDEHGVRTWIILLQPVMNTDCAADREALQSAAPQMKQLPF